MEPQTIPVLNLAFTFIPVVVVIVILFSWSLRGWQAIYALLRMLIQLIAIGYVLVFVFEADNSLLVGGILTLMMIGASWIALNPIAEQRRDVYLHTFVALSLGCGCTLLIVVHGVLQLQVWYSPQYIIPLAGIIFANSMNTVSLAAERFESEVSRGMPVEEARRTALQAGLIPAINSLMAVGVVSLPGMMTGQILSGVSPLIAVRYQVMVMAMMFGASGISAVTYLLLVSRATGAGRANEVMNQ